MARELTVREMVEELVKRHNCDLAVVESKFGLFYSRFKDLRPKQVRDLYIKSKGQFKDWSITPVVLNLSEKAGYRGPAILVTKGKPHFGEVSYLYHEWWYEDRFNEKGDYCGNSLKLFDRVGSYSKGYRLNNSIIVWWSDEDNVYYLSDNKPVIETKEE